MTVIGVQQIVAGKLPQTNAQSSNSTSATVAAKPSYTFQTQSNLVVVDVSVSDANGSPVHGLKAEDFSIFENGEKMTLQSFEEHRRDEPQSEPAALDVHLPANTFTNYTAHPAKGTLNVFVIDPLNSGDYRYQSYVRFKLLEYLQTMPAGVPVAIFQITNQLELVQGFTTDHALLTAQLTKMLPYNGQSSAERSRAGLLALTRYLEKLPGRKNVLWFSGGYPLSYLTGQAIGEGPVVGAVNDEFDTTQLLGDYMVQAHVAIYPVDLRGVQVVAADGLGQNFQLGETLVQEHQMMQVIADQTGGKAFYSTNDLAQATKEAVDDGANFYTLSYVPTNTEMDGKFRKLKVEVDRQHLELRYRQGYYADDLKEIERREKKQPTETEKDAEKHATMTLAMLHGAPTPTQMVFTAGVNATDGTESTLPEDNTPNKKLMKAPYRRYTIIYNASILDLSTSAQPNGGRQAEIELVSIVYAANGQAVNVASNAMKLNMSAADYVNYLKGGLHIRQQIDAPEKGEYSLRVGMHDLSSNRIGAVEIPLAEIKQQTASAK